MRRVAGEGDLRCLYHTPAVACVALPKRLSPPANHSLPCLLPQAAELQAQLAAVVEERDALQQQADGLRAEVRQ